MPAYWSRTFTSNTAARLVEVNPLRETLTIVNLNPYWCSIADNDNPVISADRTHGLPVPPFSMLVLKKELGDCPDVAWWLYPRVGDCYIVVFESMKNKET